MPRVVITNRVQDAERWLEFAGSTAAEVFGAGETTTFTCLDDPSKVGVALDFADGADVRLLLAAMASHPGVAQLLARGGVILDTVEIYIEHDPA